MILNFNQFLNEDAYANAGNTAGMGAVVTAQPGTIPGAAYTGNGTTGSGDIGVPFMTYTKMPVFNLLKNLDSFKQTKIKKGKKNKKSKFSNFFTFEDFLIKK